MAHLRALHDPDGALTMMAAGASLEQRRLLRGDANSARTPAVLGEIVTRMQDLAQQFETLN